MSGSRTSGVQARLALVLFGLLLLTVLGAGAVFGGGAVRPILEEVLQERIHTAMHLAREVERSSDPSARVVDLADEVELQLELLDGPPPQSDVPALEVHPRGRLVRVLRERGSPTYVSLRGPDGPRTLLIRFPADLERPERRGWLGLLVLAAGVFAAASVGARWVTRPLELAGEAMDRVADGDLGHRVPDARGLSGRIAQTFNRMADRVQGLVLGQRQLMAAVSHELRTPLTRMRLHTELLRDEGVDPRRLDALEDQISEVDELVEELLESARLDQGVLALALAPVDLAELAAEALGSVDLGERPIVLQVPQGLAVVADRRRLLRALVNLLSNARRYTPEEAEISLLAARAGQGVRLEVADRGPGVAEAELAHLFEPFFRTEQSRSKATGGLGLGLMLVRQVVEAHGGQVEARNREGGGLVVRMELPAGKEG